MRSLIAYFLRYLSLFIVFAYFNSCNSFAQEGNFHAFHYTPTIENLEKQNFAAIQGLDGTMYFANKQGVLSYDGINWELIKTPSTPQSFALDKNNNGIIYVGCKGTFGYLQINEKGQKIYKTLASNKEAGQIKKIIILQKTIYLYTQKAVLVYSSISNKTERLVTSLTGEMLSGMFSFRNNIYVNVSGRGIHILKNSSLVSLPQTEKVTASGVIFGIPYDDNHVLIGAGNNAFYLFNGTNLKPFVTEADNYFAEKFLSDAIEIRNNQLVIATLSGGVVLIDKLNKKVITTFNYQAGLPDDEVMALCSDMQGSFWLCHGYGITRVDAYLPVRKFSNYLGLEGNVTTVLKTDKTLYAGTSSGIFYLTPITSTQEIAASIQKELRKAQQAATSKIITRAIQAQASANEPNSTQNDKKNKGNLFTNIFESKKKKKEREEKQRSEEKEATTKRKTKKEQRRQAEFEKNKKRVEEQISKEDDLADNFSPIIEESLAKIESSANAYLIAGSSKPYIYKKVEGLEARCKQMVHFQGQILVATTLGLFAIDTQTQKSTNILPNVNINFIKQSSADENTWYVATNSLIAAVVFKDGNWQVVDKLLSINQEINSIVAYENIIWAGGENRVYVIALKENGQFDDYRRLDFEDEYVGNVITRLVNQELLFFTLRGIYKINQTTGKFTKYKGKFVQYHTERSKLFINQPAYTWLKNEKGWHNLENLSQKDSLKVVFVNLFKDIKDIYTDAEANLWVATETGIYCIEKNAQLNPQKTFNIFVKNIRDANGDFFSLTDLVISKEQTQLEFRFQLASPFYLNETDMEYQYRLVGLNTTQWSPWNKQSDIKIAYLTAGYYTLEVRAKNIFGKISEVQKIDFRIKPPFWETWWFYLIQIAFLAGLLAGSIYLSRSQRYGRLSNILTLLTVITIFEFLILFLEPYTDKFTAGVPIFKVVMNIMLAASLNPLEKILRKLIQSQEISIKKLKLKYRNSPKEPISFNPDNKDL